jgi:hypothetical protein
VGCCTTGKRPGSLPAEPDVHVVPAVVAAGHAVVRHRPSGRPAAALWLGPQQALRGAGLLRLVACNYTWQLCVPFHTACGRLMPDLPTHAAPCLTITKCLTLLPLQLRDSRPATPASQVGGARRGRSAAVVKVIPLPRANNISIMLTQVGTAVQFFAIVSLLGQSAFSWCIALIQPCCHAQCSAARSLPCPHAQPAPPNLSLSCAHPAPTPCLHPAVCWVQGP